MSSQHALDLAYEIITGMTKDMKDLHKEFQTLLDNLDVGIELTMSLSPNEDAISELAERIDAVARKIAEETKDDNQD